MNKKKYWVYFDKTTNYDIQMNIYITLCRNFL